MRTLVFVLVLAVWLVPGTVEAQAVRDSTEFDGIRYILEADSAIYHEGDTALFTHSIRNLREEPVVFEWLLDCRCSRAFLVFEGECSWSDGSCQGWLWDSLPLCMLSTCVEVVEPGQTKSFTVEWDFNQGNLEPAPHTLVAGLTKQWWWPWEPFFREESVVDVVFFYEAATSVPEGTGPPSSWSTIKAIYRNPN